MATFKIGQRVRIVAAPDMYYKEVVGDEVVILGLPGGVLDFPNNYEISRPPSLRANAVGLAYLASPHHLAPLTDPKADEFIARLERLGREPVGAPIVETVEVSK